MFDADPRGKGGVEFVMSEGRRANQTLNSSRF